MKHGKVIARSAEQTAALQLPGRPDRADFTAAP
jgi:hypothetical protein